MKKIICICDHCGTEFDPANGYSDLEVNNFDFEKETDLCTDCYQLLSDMVKMFICKDINE